MRKKSGLLPMPPFLSMSSRFLLVVLLVTAFLGAPVFAQETHPRAEHEVAVQTGHEAEAGGHEGVPLKAAPLWEIGSFKITNSMLVSWVVAILIILAAQAATRNIKAVPTGAQNFWEWMVESLYNFLESVIGSELVKKTFWFFATLFIFILFLNWFGLIPGVGSIGWGHRDPVTNVFHVERPLLRGGNADLNMTFAMAAVFFVLWIY